MATTAIVTSGGKQYKVEEGSVIYIDKVEKQPEDSISFDVLMVIDGENTRIGNPTVAGARVEGKVVAQVKGEKILVGKYKSKKNFDRKTGHRQSYTKVEITAIVG